MQIHAHIFESLQLEGLSIIGDGGKVAISLTPDQIDGIGSGSLLDSILSTFLLADLK